VAATFGGLYTTHIRGEGENSVRAISEAIEIAEKAGLPCHILHFKSNGQANWGRMPELVKLIQAARDRGVDITANQYPYPEGRNYELTCLAFAER
jgi:N-acyl-D-amino-acid deacylase